MLQLEELSIDTLSPNNTFRIIVPSPLLNNPNPIAAPAPIIPSINMPNKMPKVGERGAPTFSNEKPEELPRFFRIMEEWFADDTSLTDQQKKQKLVDYVAIGVDEEWKAFAEFDTGTYDEFKEAIKKSYPTVALAESASADRLRRKVKLHPSISLHQSEHVASLTRIMRAEIGKLNKINPPLITNHELVTLFLEKLDPEFRQLLAHNLRTQISLVRDAAQQAQRKQHGEDPFTIEEVFKMAAFTSEESKSPLGKFFALAGPAPPTTLTNANADVKAEEMSAKILDTLDSQRKTNSQFQQSNEQVLKAIERQTHLLNNFLTRQANYRPPYQPQNASYNVSSQTPAPSHQHNHQHASGETCFYCGEQGHRVHECVDAIRDEESGFIAKGNDNKYRLANGSYIPYERGRPMKEYVAEQHKRGIIPVKKTANGIVSTNIQGEVDPVNMAGQKDEALSQLLEHLVGNLGLEGTKATLDHALQRSYFASEDDSNFQ